MSEGVRRQTQRTTEDEDLEFVYFLNFLNFWKKKWNKKIWLRRVVLSFAGGADEQKAGEFWNYWRLEVAVKSGLGDARLLFFMKKKEMKIKLKI